ncbi:MAG: ABC transporter permease [Eubacteriales bacterium]|nr:ABC transporter permease [Eubacteriales bacterium]
MKYVKFISKRVLYMLITLFITSFVIFFLLHIFGADPILTICANKNVDGTIKDAMRKQYHLDQPLIEQYFIWLKGAVCGDFGVSYVGKLQVGTEIMNKVPVTAALIIGTSLCSFLLAIPLGVIQSVFAGRKLDTGIMVVLLVLASTPSFLLGLIALLIVPQILPGYSISGGYSNTAEFLSRVSIPCIVLSFVNIALLARLMRNSIVEQMNQNYVMTARAKGFSYMRTMLGHIVPNSIIPVLTVGSIMIGGIVSESMLVEQVFSLPGMGSILIKAISENDFPITMAITMIMLIIFMVCSMMIDIIYTLIDPRVEL